MPIKLYFNPLTPHLLEVEHAITVFKPRGNRITLTRSIFSITVIRYIIFDLVKRIVYLQVNILPESSCKYKIVSNAVFRFGPNLCRYAISPITEGQWIPYLAYTKR